MPGTGSTAIIGEIRSGTTRRRASVTGHRQLCVRVCVCVRRGGARKLSCTRCAAWRGLRPRPRPWGSSCRRLHPPRRKPALTLYPTWLQVSIKQLQLRSHISLFLLRAKMRAGESANCRLAGGLQPPAQGTSSCAWPRRRFVSQRIASRPHSDSDLQLHVPRRPAQDRK